MFRWWVVFALGSACDAASSAPAEPITVESVARVDADHVSLSPGAASFVRTAAVTSGTSVVVEAPARVAFKDGAIARVGPPVPGRVMDVHVELGARVEAGAPLFTLGSADAAQARAELRHARASLRAAQLELERQSTLTDRGVGLARDRVEAEAAVAQAETEVARAQQANALLGRDRGGVVVVRAPIAGRVLSRAVTRGSVVDPAGAPLIEIGDPDALWVVAEVFDHEVELVREGARAEVEVPGAVTPITATVVAIGGSVDLRTRRAPVWLELERRPPGLRAGTYARAEIDASAESPAVVPTSAVVLRDGLQALVYVATDEPGVFERRAVAVGRPFRGRTPVLEGLASGDAVVVEGVLLLDGAAEQLL